MRTFFEIVLGILFTVLKACLHALLSTAGALVFLAGAALLGIYLWRRGLAGRRPAHADNVIPINR